MSPTLPLTVYGVQQSFFTRKVTGYLDHEQLPWRLRRGLGPSQGVRDAGWPGGIPAVIEGDGAVMWDSTSVILHLEHHFPDRSVFPADPTLPDAAPRPRPADNRPYPAGP